MYQEKYYFVERGILNIPGTNIEHEVIGDIQGGYANGLLPVCERHCNHFNEDGCTPQYNALGLERFYCEHVGTWEKRGKRWAKAGGNGHGRQDERDKI